MNPSPDPTYSGSIRRLELNDDAHPDVFTPMHQALLDNDVVLDRDTTIRATDTDALESRYAALGDLTAGLEGAQPDGTPFVRRDAPQTLTGAQQTTARSNLAAAAYAHTHAITNITSLATNLALLTTNNQPAYRHEQNITVQPTKYQQRGNIYRLWMDPTITVRLMTRRVYVPAGQRVRVTRVYANVYTSTTDDAGMALTTRVVLGGSTQEWSTPKTASKTIVVALTPPPTALIATAGPSGHVYLELWARITGVVTTAIVVNPCSWRVTYVIEPIP